MKKLIISFLHQSIAKTCLKLVVLLISISLSAQIPPIKNNKIDSEIDALQKQTVHYRIRVIKNTSNFTLIIKAFY